MKSLYHKNYFKSISNGLKNTIYEIEKKEVNGNLLFEEINKKLKKIKKKSSNLYFFGNGASAAFANHMALDFSKNGKILSKSLSDSVMLTAFANDFSYEEALVEFLKINRANKDDLVITISSSGNSPNILNALKYCKKMKIKTLSLSGLKKNKSIDNSNYSIYVPMRTYGIVECVHQIFLHLILDRSMEVEEWSRNDFQNMNINEFNI